MSATLRCSRCHRQPWQELNVHVTDDGVALCDGPDCDELALGFFTGIPKRRTSAVLALAGAAALMGAGFAAPGGTRWDRARARRTRANHGDPGAQERLAAAQAKRARRAAKRLRTTEGAAPGDDFDGSRSTPHAAQPVPA